MTTSDQCSNKSGQGAIEDKYFELGEEIEQVVGGARQELDQAYLALRELEVQSLFLRRGAPERKNFKKRLEVARLVVADLESMLAHALIAHGIVEAAGVRIISSTEKLSQSQVPSQELTSGTGLEPELVQPDVEPSPIELQ